MTSEAALGATWDGRGVRFAVFSQHATAIDISLFDNEGRERRETLQRDGDVWSCYVADIGPGQRYGYRVSGPWQPEQGHLFNPHKLLLDPYARAVSGQVDWRTESYAYNLHNRVEMDQRDNAACMSKSVVVDPSFDWGDDRRLSIPMQDSVLYELHIKGFTRRHPAVAAEDRGTYLGLIAPAVLDYLRQLGVTTLELLPCAYSVTSPRLRDLGLQNYWGYDPLLWFAPDPRFAKHDAVSEFKQMVKGLHNAGFEVILDVVFNHSGEEGLLGPHLCFRGFDNAVYYRHDKAKPGEYFDFTGCGNTINCEHPQVMQMLIDCLRYWVQEMHVDGFRFDLATTVMREQDKFKTKAKLLQRIGEDPLLSQVKLIAEPWDLGPDGYQLGRFPPPWSEWNDRCRDTLRAYWRGDENGLKEFSRRFAGSPDLFQIEKRSLTASINFITAHDGFTLRDLVCYEQKHNQDNGEDNRDGHNHNLSRNYGVEGPSDDPQIETLRARQQRNLLASLLLSRGVPMLLAGDEINRSQNGNNNAYCQDNEINWLSWKFDAAAESLLEFARLLIRLRRSHALFRPLRLHKSTLRPHLGYRDMEWLRPDGKYMLPADWRVHYARFVALLLTAEEADAPHFLLLFNAGDSRVECTLPPTPADGHWHVVFDTACWPRQDFDPLQQTRYELESHSLVLLTERKND